LLALPAVHCSQAS